MMSSVDRSDLEERLTTSINAIRTSPTFDHNNFPIYCRGRQGQLVCRQAVADDEEDDDDDCSSSVTMPLISTSNSSSYETGSGPKSFCHRAQCITVEPWVLLFAIGYFLQTTVVKNVILEKLCLQSDFNTSDCMNTTNATLENELQVRTSTIEMYTSLVETFPSVVTAVFLGSYGDRRSRKVTMVIPLIGSLLSAVIYGVFSHFMQEIPVEYMPLAIIPRALTGGLIAALMSALSFVAQRSQIQHRTLRVAAVEVAAMLGLPLGSLAGGYLYLYSYTLVFISAFGLLSLALLYVIIMIHDDVTARLLDSLDDKWFSFKDYRDTFFAFFRNRDTPHTRAYILLLSAALCFNFFLVVGQLSSVYLYIRLRFNWDLKTFTYFGAMLSASMSLGMLLNSIILIRILKLHDLILAPISFLFSVAINLMYAYLPQAKYLYLMCIPQLFTGIAALTIRSQISKLVNKDEQGKVFSVLGSIEGVLPLVSSVVFTQVYNATVATRPQTVFLMSAGVFFIPLLMSLAAGLHMRWKSKTGSGYASL